MAVGLCEWDCVWVPVCGHVCVLVAARLHKAVVRFVPVMAWGFVCPREGLWP